MAGYACGGCDGGEQAVLLITPLNGAETLAVGQECLPVTLCGILAGTINADPEQLWEAVASLPSSGQADGQDAARDDGQDGGAGEQAGGADTGPAAGQDDSAGSDQRAKQASAQRGQAAARRGGRR